MKHTAQRAYNRRELVRSGLRYLALGGVSLLWAGLAIRGSLAPCPSSLAPGPWPLISGGRCPRQLPCAQCAALPQCRLSPALAAKGFRDLGV
jgi:hypothetical protein